jgi:hypothetical protein
VALSTTLLWAQTPIVTWHYDNARSGTNTTEVLLTPNNVNYQAFGKVMTQPVDGFIIGHPLYLPAVSIPGSGVHNVVYVATMNDTVYAFDANTGNIPPLWTTSLLSYSPAGATPVPISVKGCASTVQWTQTGVISTPVIDPSNGTMYLVAETYESGNAIHRLHALDVATGTERPGWPVRIAAKSFVDKVQMNRPGLLLSNGHVYVAFGGSSCNGGDHGWVMSYNAATAQQEGAFDVEPGQQLASIWQRGAGISTDADGYIYAETGEGPVSPGVNLGVSVLKLSQTGSTLSLVDWFTPWNWSTLNARDLDLNNGVVILPDQSGTHPHEAVTVGKEGTIYVLDRDNLGQLCTTCTSSDTQLPQELPTAAVYAYTPVVWNGSVYIYGSSAVHIYSLTNGTLTLKKSVVLGSVTHPMITANGKTNGILWLINGAMLKALDAVSLNTLYASNQAPNGRDTLPPYAHFASPIAADGKVFVGTQNSLVVYGQLPNLSVVTGNSQSAPVASTLPVALEVKAIDPIAGKTLSGVTVTFSDGGKGGKFSSATGVTDANGTVQTTYMLPSKVASYTVTASASGLGAATFTETATASSPSLVAIISGKGQTAAAGTVLPNPVVARVGDVYGNAVPGVAVTFSDKGAGGSFSADPVNTDAKGHATVSYTAGTSAGNLTITAQVAGLRAASVPETVVAGPAASIAVVSGDGQSASVSTALPQPLVAQVKDQYGNPVNGVNVQFSDGGAGGSFTTSTIATDATGVASVSYTTPAAAGAVSIHANVSGVNGSAMFSVQVN